ncbi:DUF2487 family protein [Paenibacillus sp. TAB 01]|uniref:DUF2487 family protein n=1 Tax=Paenibacillus sp. TAB 01 TaxID=3368988 RepID=UPI0037524BF2
MKFSDVEASSWPELQPYVDTCLLPVTGLSGDEQPWEATQALEALRDALDCLEIPYKGRVLTYPAFHFVDGQAGEELLSRTCARLKQQFRYVVIVTAKTEAALPLEKVEADALFVLTPEMIANSKSDVRQSVSAKVQQLWTSR